MMNTIYRNSSNEDVTQNVQRDYYQMARDGIIDMNKVLAALLVALSCEDEECREMFNAIMYLFAMYFQCDGRMIFRSRDYRTISQANNELIEMLATDR